MRGVVSVLGFLIAIGMMISGCGGGGSADSGIDDTTTETSTAASTLPEPGPLPAGEYRSEEFEPALSFEVGEGWEVAGPELPEALGIGQGREVGGVFFFNPREVFDPGRLGEGATVPAPDDWVAWFQEHPHIDIEEPVDVTVGGIAGIQFDSVVASAPTDYPPECPEPCVPFLPLSDGGAIDFSVGERGQNIVLEDVEGETVLIQIGGPPARLEDFLPKAQEVLDTVQWEAKS